MTSCVVEGCGATAQSFFTGDRNAIVAFSSAPGTEFCFASNAAGNALRWSPGGIPQELMKLLNARSRSLPGVAHVAFHPDGRYFVTFADGTIRHDGSSAAVAQLGAKVRVSFGPEGRFVVIPERPPPPGGAAPISHGVTNRMRDVLRTKGERVVDFALHPTHPHKFAALFDDGTFAAIVDPPARAALERQVGPRLRRVFLGDGAAVLLHTESTPVSAGTGASQRPSVSAALTTAPAAMPATRVAGLQPTTMIRVDIAADHRVDTVANRVYYGPVDAQGLRHGPCGICAYHKNHPGDWAWYVGGFDRGQCSGVRALLEVKSDGSIYHGDVKNGKFDGRGTQLLFLPGDGGCGGCRVGVFKNGHQQGFGVRSFVDGGWSIGFFSGGEREGQFETFYPPGSDRRHFMGHYHAGEISKRRGSMRYADGSLFCGSVPDERGNRARNVAQMDGIPSEMREWPYLRRLTAEATAFAQKAWPGASLTQLLDDQRPVTEATQRFVRGLRLLHRFGANPEGGPVFFGFHGSNPESIAGIVRDGFDTTRRNLQNQGPGEYLAVRPRDAVVFSAAGSQKLLVVAAVSGPQLLVCDSFCAAVFNPPSCSGHAFCVPVLEVSYTDADAARLIAATGPEASGRRWQHLWKGDDGYNVPYTAVQNDALCNLHSRRLRKDPNVPGTVRFQVHRHNDHQVEEYEINARTYVQTNLRTKFKRNVVWRRVPGYPSYYVDPLASGGGNGGRLER